MDKIFDLGPIKVVDFNVAYSPAHIANAVINVDVYGTRRIPFQAGDVVIDIGANIGIFSIYLAVLHPEITIYSFEPSAVNYHHLLKGIEMNGVTNIRPFQLALTDDARNIWISLNEDNSGGACMYAPISGHCNISRSMRLDDVISENKIEKVKMLKCDCEGAEYEIFKDFKQWDKIEHFGGEIHPFKKNSKYDYDLAALVLSKLDDAKVSLETSYISGIT